jgi:hypothetical protein
LSKVIGITTGRFRFIPAWKDIFWSAQFVSTARGEPVGQTTIPNFLRGPNQVKRRDLEASALRGILFRNDLRMNPETPGLEFAFELHAECDPPLPIGDTPSGKAALIPITGGHFEGPNIKGTVLPGGADWPYTRLDGVNFVEARYPIRTDDGVIVQVWNRGPMVPGTKARTMTSFVAPIGKYDWLNKSVFVGTLEVPSGPFRAVIVRFFRVV